MVYAFPAFNKFGYQKKILNISILLLILNNKFNWLKLTRGTTFKGREKIANLLIESHKGTNYKFGTLINNSTNNYNQNHHLDS